MVTSVVTSTIRITTTLEGPQIQLTRCLLNLLVPSEGLCEGLAEMVEY
eukprot:SAG11_NODE_431_length_9526_cov_11.297019_1_plen_48_part_00